MTNIPPFGCDVRNASAEQKREFLELLTRYEDETINTWSGVFHYYGIDANGEAQGIMNCKDNFQEEFFTRIIPIEQGIAILKGEEEKQNDGWISVKDKMPNKDGNSSISCLCYDSYHNQIRVLSYNEHHGCWDDESADDYYTDAIGGKVTHWMPLPNPPKQ